MQIGQLKRREFITLFDAFVFGEAVGTAVNEVRVRIADVALFNPRAAQGAVRIETWDSVVDENKPWSAPG